VTLETSFITTFIDSNIAVDVKFTVTVTETVSPGAAEAVDALNVKPGLLVDVFKTAVACPEPKTPKLNEATKASATRLKVVDLLVISFLSKVVSETFPNTADKDNVFIS
jgi:hypothetical protein